MSMAQMCKLNQPFHLEHLLRWGHASATWDLSGKTSIADAGLRFARSLNLTGEGRRLTEMFSHFIQVRLPALKLKKQAVTFGADGLLITVIVRCTPEPGMHVRDAAEELRIHDFPISVVNRLGDGSFEIGALHYPFQTGADAAERIVMVFNKSQDAVAEESSADPLPPVDKAG
jgi:hypothetical protein